MSKSMFTRWMIVPSMILAFLLIVGCGEQATFPDESLPAEVEIAEEGVVAVAIEEAIEPAEPPSEDPGVGLDSTNVCDQPDAEFIPVGEAAQVQEIDSEFLPGNPAFVADVTNDAGQTMRLIVHSANPDASQEFLARISVCFLAKYVGPPSSVVASSVPLDDILLNTMLEITGATKDELLTIRDEFIAMGETPTLAKALEEIYGVESQEVINVAIEVAIPQIEAAVAAGEITEVEGNDLRQNVETLYADALQDETFSIVNGDDAGSLDITDELTRYPENIFVELDWLDRPDDDSVEEYEIDYGLDPPIGRSRRIWLSWQKIRYPYGYLKVTKGRVSLGLWYWDGDHNRIGYTTASAVSYSRTLRPSPYADYYGSCSWYRVHTYGRADGNYYIIYGTWRYASSSSCG